MLTRLGGGLYRARWALLLFTLLLTAIMGWYGLGVFDSLGSATLGNPKDESIRAAKLLNTTFGTKTDDKDSFLLLLKSDELKATDPAYQQAATQLFDTLKQRSEVLSIQSYYSTHSANFLSRDEHETFAVVNVSTRNGGSTTYHKLEPLFKAPGLDVKAGGSLAVTVQFNDQLKKDLEFAEVIALPIVAILLVIIFGGLTSALMPLIIGGFAIVGSFTLLRILTHFIDVSSFATNVVTIIGLGLAIDYSLFIITRFREELSHDPTNIKRAIQKTMGTAGRTVLFSGLTVCTSLLSLLVIDEPVLHSIGLATIASALVAMLGALTVLPVILALLGTRINTLSLQRLFSRREANSQKQGAWYHLSYFVMRWRIPVTTVLILFLLALGIPFLHASFASTDERSLPLSSPARAVIDDLNKNFEGQNNTTISVAITTHGDALSSDNLAKLDDYVTDASKLQGVINVQSVVTLNPQLTLANYQQLYAHPTASPIASQLTEAAKQFAKGDVEKVTIIASFDPHSSATQDLVKQVRGLHHPDGFDILVGGGMAQQVDQFTNLSSSIPRALLVMAIAIFVLLFLMTGSIVMPIKAILLNILSLTATFGALVWIFQDGNLQNLLGFKAFGALDSTQPVLIFAIAFGLSMDYEVFLLSRIKEQFDKTQNNKEAVAVGLQKTGWLVTSAAMLLSVVVAAFATSRIIFIQEIGVGISLAILMDATIVRALLVPAMMALLGNWNWWAPRPLQKVWQYIGLREPTEDEPILSDEKQSVEAPSFV
ncbi:MMPL family transporter [Tengunoibacter tsumagoiensis]|uniref:Putative conserved membrane protein, MmpL family n=1 Tax=Tengunoibacter tsumagoiensis TaxID=2014871 RepID=A0A402A5S6_9CHLR|nr:MMPL family transporter [Tengunoibacter tsumagoiensis]GCE14429.1 putative conserved membrane protein, MmpL family [Tengunoibacter tsumagoiensis]